MNMLFAWLWLVAAMQAPSAPKQAVVETSAGTFVIDLAADAAPNQTAYFMKLASEHAYDRTTFHRMVQYGIVQGGDPLSADPQYTVFGHVSDGMDVVQKISSTPVDEKGLAIERVEIRTVTIRETPPEPFSTETAQQLASYRAVLDTSAGPITIEFFPDKAPGHVRQFLRLAQAGVFDTTAFHRVVPGFVIQTGSLSSRATPLTEKQQRLVHSLQPEFNDTKHVKGIVSMARADDPASATTSFFICTAPAPALDGKYSAFGRVVDGMAAVEAIEASPRKGETPVARIELKTVRIDRVGK